MNEWIIQRGLFIVFVNYTLTCSESGCFCYVSGCFASLKCAIKDLVNELLDDVLYIGLLNQHNIFQEFSQDSKIQYIKTSTWKAQCLTEVCTGPFFGPGSAARRWAGLA